METNVEISGLYPILSNESNILEDKKTFELTAKVLLALRELTDIQNPKLEEAIKAIIVNKHLADVGAILIELCNTQQLDRSVLVKIFKENHSLASNPALTSWWQKEKNVIRGKYNERKIPKKGSTKNLLDTLIKHSNFEAQLVENLKAELTEFCRRNFYVYISGNNFVYSINPNDETLGIRMKSDGTPLTDGDGNELTDTSGNFRYAIIEIIENGKSIIEKKITQNITQDTQGATPLADKNGVALSKKYRELVENEKPKKIPKTQADAANYLLQLIDNVSAYEIYQFISTPNFQNLIGDERRLKFGKINLAEICKKFISSYKDIKTKTENETIFEILLDDKKFASLTEDQISVLFWNYNPFVFADVIVNLYHDVNFKVKDISFAMLQELLNLNAHTLDEINLKRCQHKAQPLLPPGFCSPGKNTFEDEQLTKLQLFQYEQQTIAAADHWLRSQFPHLIINASPEINPFDRLDNNAPYYFYQIPANAYMLLEPVVEKMEEKTPNYYRYKAFRQQLRGMLQAENCFNKPIIFFGIINIDNVHYLPYFVSKVGSNITVITVDPSPMIYPAKYQDNAHIDSKTIYYAKANRIFHDIFPDCYFFDPCKTQMLRERDCGPNSAQTVYDALLSARTEIPLLYFNDNNQLSINSNRLTIKHEPIGINPYSKTYVYTSQVEMDSNNNRSEWQKRLSTIEDVIYFYPDQEDFFSLLQPYNMVPEKYSYVDQVNQQIIFDEKNINISTIQSILISTEEGRQLIQEIIHAYKETLEIPNLNNIIDYLKAKVDAAELSRYTSAHQNNLNSLLNDVVNVIVRDYVPQALEMTLVTQVLNQLPNRIELLNSDQIVEEFLTKNQTIFKSLPSSYQTSIREKLMSLTNQAVTEKLKTIYCGIFQELLARNCYNYLTKIESRYEIFNIETLANQIDEASAANPTQFFTDNKLNPDTIYQTVNYLASNFSPIYYNILETETSKMAQQVLKSTLDYVRQKLAIEFMTLKELLSYFNPGNGVFMPPALEKLLPERIISKVLSYKHLNTALGNWLINQLNVDLQEQFYHALDKKIQTHLNAFNHNSKFRTQLLGNYSLADIDFFLTKDNDIAIEIDFEPSIQTIGSPETITNEDYKHPVARNFIQQELRYAAAKIFVEERDTEFSIIGDMIFKKIKHTLTVNFLKDSMYDFGNLAQNLLQNALKDDNALQTIFTKNFLNSSGQYNQCGRRFYQYFQNTYVSTIATVYPQAKNLLDHIQLARENVAALKDQIDNFALESHLAAFDELIDWTLRFNTYYQMKLTILTTNFKKIIRDIVVSLMDTKSRYVKGDITPGSAASLLRPTLCSLLGIETEILLTPSRAKAVDEFIVSQTSLLEEEFSPIPEIRESNLIRLNQIKQLPKTNKVPLTFKILTDLVAYWLTNRNFFTNLHNYFDQVELPPIIYQLIKLLNESHRSGTQIKYLLSEIRQLLPTDIDAQLVINTSNDLTSQVSAALLKSKDFLGDDFANTAVSFSSLMSYLQGKAVDSFNVKKKSLSKEEFNKKVDAIVTQRLESDSEIKLSPTNLITEVENELRQEFTIEIEGEDTKERISPIEFLSKTNAELKRRIAENKKQKEALEPEQQDSYVGQSLDINRIREDLKLKYTVIQEADIAKELDLSVFPKQEQLQRKGLQKLTFFGNTELDKELIKLRKTRHHDDDTIDTSDLEYFVKLLKQRWQSLYLIENDNARFHYMTDSPNTQDSQYITLAAIVAQNYRLKGKIVFIYELLMPGYYFTPSSKLKTTELDIETTNMLKGSSLRNITIDNIPLTQLITTRSGYALDIKSVIDNYIRLASLNNPYTNTYFTIEEIEDICQHPDSKILIDKIKANCQSGITRKAIDILEEYVNDTVFENGYHQNYNTSQNKLVEGGAAPRFWHNINTLPPAHKLALLAEPIPNTFDTTVESIMAASATKCVTLKGDSLAKVIYVYKGDQNDLKAFIQKRIPKDTINRKPFLNEEDMFSQNRTEKFKLEEYILNLNPHSGYIPR